MPAFCPFVNKQLLGRELKGIGYFKVPFNHITIFFANRKRLFRGR